MKKKNLLFPLIIAVTMMTLCPQTSWAQTKPASGDGSSTSPFLISTTDNLVWYQQYVNGMGSGEAATVHTDACAKLTADIDLSTVCSSTLGSWTSIATFQDSTYCYKYNHFTGTFDGNGHTISNLYARGKKNFGLFGYIYGATIKNLRMSNVDVSPDGTVSTGNSYIGAVAGYSNNTVFENVEVMSGTVYGGMDVGGITGGHATATKCVNRAELHVLAYSGGISGGHSSTMTDCENYGNIYVTATDYTAGQVGGVTGGTPQSGSTISNCKNFGNITVTTESSASTTAISEGIGGVVGHVFCATLTDCSNFGNITVNTKQSAVGRICGGGTQSNTISGTSYIRGTLTENGSTVTSYYGSASFTSNNVTVKTGSSYYYVSFNLNGHGTNIPSQVVSSGAKATEPTAPTADGYAFGGWYTNAACTSAFGFSTTITANTTLYAKWHTMVYQDNGDGTHSYCCKDGDYVESTAAHSYTYTTEADGTKKAECTCGLTHTFAADDETMCVCTTAGCGHGFFRYTADKVVTPYNAARLMDADGNALNIISNTCTDGSGVIEFEKPLVTIGEKAFYNCSGITGSLTIPNSVTSIGEKAFYNCSGITGSLTIPNSVTSIGKYAFCECNGFTGSLTIPNSVTSIGDYAFNNCNGFTGSLTILNSVTSIGEKAFYNCSGFTGSLTIPNSVTSIGEKAFCYCIGFTGSLTIPNSVTNIGNEAFYKCSGFTGSLTIPNSVTSIGEDAFSDCSSLTGIEFNSIPSVGRNAVYNTTSNKTLKLTDDSYVYTGSNKYFPSLGSAPTYTRTISNEWETLVLPFDFMVDESLPCHFYEPSILDGTTLAFKYLTGTIKAGTPVFIKTDASELDGKTYTLTLTAANTSVDATTALTATAVSDLALTGTYQSKDVKGEAGYYLLDNTLTKIGSESCVISPFRAYLAGSNDASSISLTIRDLCEEKGHDYENGYCTRCGAFELTLSDNGTTDDTSDDYYEINNAHELCIFSTYVNDKNQSANAKVMADIDFTSSTETTPMIATYKGIFDGNGKKITVKIDRTEDDAALFKNLYGTVKNLTVAGTITTSKKYAAGICAHSYGATITGCTSLVDIESTISGDGTHAGLCAVAETGGVTISNCVFAGQMNGSITNSCGGLVGWAGNTPTTISNSLVAATFGVGTSNSNTISRNPGNATITNCYYENALGDVPGNTTQVTATQLASGYVAYQLNGNSSTGAWGQNIDSDPKDEIPVIGGKTVYPKSCSGDCSNDPNTVTAIHPTKTTVAEVAATCTEAGAAAHKVCDVCGAVFDMDDNETTLDALAIAALGHSFGTDGKCTHCGTSVTLKFMESEKRIEVGSLSNLYFITNGDASQVTYEFSNSEVASISTIYIDNDLYVEVSANQLGTAVLTLRYGETDITATCIVKVVKPTLSYNMPTDGSTIDVSLDADETVNIYDDGGSDDAYSNNANGTICLTAPEGYLLEVTGNLSADVFDYLSIDGDIWKGYGYDYAQIRNISQTSSDNTCEISFSSDGTVRGEGFALSVTAIPDPNYFTVKSVASVAKLVNYINGNTACVSNPSALDVNGDGTVDVKDVEETSTRLLKDGRSTVVLRFAVTGINFDDSYTYSAATGKYSDGSDELTVENGVYTFPGSLIIDTVNKTYRLPGSSVLTILGLTDDGVELFDDSYTLKY